MGSCTPPRLSWGGVGGFSHLGDLRSVAGQIDAGHIPVRMGPATHFETHPATDDDLKKEVGNGAFEHVLIRENVPSELHHELHMPLEFHMRRGIWVSGDYLKHHARRTYLCC